MQNTMQPQQGLTTFINVPSEEAARRADIPHATYKVSYNGNIAIAEGGTVTPIAVAIVVNGEPRLTSRAISTPAAAEQFNSVTSPATIKVPRGCCFTLAVEYISGITDGTTIPTPVIDQINGNLEINRIA